MQNAYLFMWGMPAVAYIVAQLTYVRLKHRRQPILRSLLHKLKVAISFQRRLITTIKGNSTILIFAAILMYISAVYKFGTDPSIDDLSVFLLYSVLTTSYLIIRYSLSLKHTPDRFNFGVVHAWPSVSVVVPAYNEGKAIYDTIKAIANAKYQKNRLEVIIVNDGSTDDTHQWIVKSVEDFGSTWPIKYINNKNNSGKRECMYIGYHASRSTNLVFIDSDSIVEENCIKELMRPLIHSPEIAAVSGHAYVSNATTNVITRMQEIRYFSAFRALKAFESMLGYVSCCSGCCASYRRKDMDKIIEAWMNQEFLGEKCTYGDDRSLTNMLLKSGKKAVYNQKAITYTAVPDTYKKYAKQQLRWKKSWVRESILQLGYAFKKRPIFIAITLLNVLLPMFAPFVIFRYLMWYATIDYRTSLMYLMGLIFTALIYGLYYKAYHKKSKKWLFGSLYFSFINISLAWQLPYAFFKLKDTKWGTR